MHKLNRYKNLKIVICKFIKCSIVMFGLVSSSAVFFACSGGSSGESIMNDGNDGSDNNTSQTERVASSFQDIIFTFDEVDDNSTNSKTAQTLNSGAGNFSLPCEFGGSIDLSGTVSVSSTIPRHIIRNGSATYLSCNNGFDAYDGIINFSREAVIDNPNYSANTVFNGTVNSSICSYDFINLEIDTSSNFVTNSVPVGTISGDTVISCTDTNGSYVYTCNFNSLPFEDLEDYLLNNCKIDISI